MINAVIYVRVSTEEQKKGYSLQTQLERCLEYAQQNQYVVLEQFQDSKSGEELQRPGLDALYDFVAQNPVDLVIVYDPDRLSRGGPAHTAIIEMRLERYNVKLEYVLGDYNSGSPESALSLMIKQSIAWYENQQRRERGTRGKNAKARAGKVITGARPPYGYNYVNGNLHINEEEARIVRQIYAWVLSGESCRKIAKYLCDQKVPTRADKVSHMRKQNTYGVWGPSSVKKILNNPTYAGIWHYNKTQTIKVDGKRRHIKRSHTEWIAVDVPALITEETFQAVQQQLHTNRAVAKRNTKYDYLLQGMIYCTCGLVCGCRRRHDLYYYKCAIKGGEVWKRQCETRFGIRTTVLESLVWEAITDLLLNPEYLKTEIAKQRVASQDKLQTFEERLSAVQSVITDTNRKIGILLDHMLDGEFPQSIIDERRHLLSDKLRKLQAEEQQIKAERAAAVITEEQEDTLIQFAGAIRQGLEHTNFEQKRQILQILRVRVHAIDKHRVKISGYIPFQEEMIDLGAFAATSYSHCVPQRTRFRGRVWLVLAPSRLRAGRDSGWAVARQR